MATTADFRSGLCIIFNQDIYSVVTSQHVKPGKGPAFVRTKLKNIKTGKVIENTFTAGHKIITARIEKRKYQFLYKNDLGYCFMDTKSFEQVIIDKKLIPHTDLIKDGENVDILFHVENNEVIGCELPHFVILKVIYTEPGVKGNTVTNVTKLATLETNAQIQVPLFINQNEMIKIDTRTRSYLERVK